MVSFLDTLEDEDQQEPELSLVEEEDDTRFLDTLEDEESEELALPDEPRGAVISQGSGPSLFDKMRRVFSDPGKQSAEAVQALVDSKMLNISPSNALRLRGPIDRGVKINPAAAKLRSSLTQTVGDKLDRGYAQVNSGLWNFEDLTGNKNPEVMEAITQTEKFLARPEAIPETRIEEAVASAAEMFPFLAESARHGGWRGITLAGGSILIGTAAGIPEVAYPLAAGMYAVGQTSASLEFVSKVEAGLAYSELRNFKDPVTGEQIDENVARAAAYGVGAINGMLEYAQLKTLIKTIPGGKKLLSGLILDTVKEVAEKKSLLAIAGKYGKRYGKMIGKETLQETAQESTNIVADIFSRKLTNALKDTNLSMPEIAEIKDRLNETIKTSAQAFAVMGLPGNVMSVGYDVRQQRQAAQQQQVDVRDRIEQVVRTQNLQTLEAFTDSQTTPEDYYHVSDEELTEGGAEVDLTAILGDEAAEDSFVSDLLVGAGYPAVNPQVTAFVDRMEAGDPIDSLEDLQFYENNAAAVESELTARFGEEDVPGSIAPIRDNTQQIAATLDPEIGGSTYSLAGEDMFGTPNISVAVFPEFAETVPVAEIDERLAAFQAKHADLISKNPFLKVGTWKQDDEIVLDIVATIPTSNIADAEALGKKYNQEAIFNLETGEEITTGGTGDVNDMEGTLPSVEERMSEVKSIIGETVTLTHWSKTSGLQSLDPSFFGTGINAEEGKRKINDPDNWVDRTSYGMEGYVKEPTLGPYKYTVDVPLADLYDYQADPDGLMPEARKANETNPWANVDSVYERMIKEAGYKGYWIQHGKGKQARLFESAAPNEDIPGSIAPLQPVNIESDAFKRWFGNSQVVDENGKPLVVYHGTRLPYMQMFDKSLQGTGVVSGGTKSTEGFFFTTDRLNAEYYADYSDLPDLTKYSENDIQVYGEKGEIYNLITDKNGDAVINNGPFKTFENAETDAKQMLQYEFKERDPFVKELYISLQNPFMSKTLSDRTPNRLKQLRKEGYDGVIIKDVLDGQFVADTIVVFNPTQIKSAISNTGEFSLDDPSITASIAPIWYSALQRGVEGLKQEVAPAGQWMGMINKLPVRAEELEWIDLKGWLDEQDGKVTKQEILDFIAANNVQVEEKVLGDIDEGDVEAWWTDEGGANETVPYSELSIVSQAAARTRYQEEVGQYEEDSTGTKFSQYQIPGGENYKELLLTMPKNRGYKDAEIRAKLQKMREQGLRETPEFQRLVQEGIQNSADTTQSAYTSGHWDESNVLSHIRFNERTGPNGEKILFVEEIQSDWHQEGRKKGYRGKTQTINKDSASQRFFGKDYDQVSDLDKKLVDKYLSEYGGLTSEEASLVPNAPFKKSWPLLAIKRMVRYAAENGFDQIAWTPGEVQAERYDLSKHIDSVSFTKVDEGFYELYIHKNGHTIFNSQKMPVSKIEDTVGKELTEKIVEKENGTLSGLDLKVGGEGMKGFYDKMLPKMVNKFFGKKAWGKAKVGVTSIDVNPSGIVSGDEALARLGIPEDERGNVWRNMGQDERDEALQKERESKQYQEVWTLPITDKMRDKALSEGMPQAAVTPVKPVPRTKLSSILDVLQGSVTLKLKRTGNRASIQNVADYFSRGKRSLKNKGKIATQLAEDTFRLSQEAGFRSTEKSYMAVDEALDLLETQIPELKKKTNRDILKIALAITSNGQAVDENLTNAISVFEAWLADGKFPETGAQGKEAPAIDEGFRKLNQRLKTLGVKETIKSLMTYRTVKELNDLGFTISGELKGTSVPEGVIFGPKVGGAFMQNLLGNEDPITMDRWFMRTWGRVTGETVFPEESAKKGQVVEAPRNGTEREWIREVFDHAVKILKNYYDFETTNSHMQAILWDGERALYKKLGIPGQREGDNYYGSAKKYIGRRFGPRALQQVDGGTPQSVQEGSPATGPAATEGTGPRPFTSSAVQSEPVQEAVESGLISTEQAAVIDGVMAIVDEKKWGKYFDVRISGQRFTPSVAQLKAHNVPPSQAGLYRLEGVLLTEENLQDLKDDVGNVAVIFQGGDVTTFFHEFGEFAFKRLLTGKGDMATVNREYKAGGSKLSKNEWFSNSFRDWWVKTLASDSDIVSPELHTLYQKMVNVIKEVWQRIKSLGTPTPAIDELFTDIITNGREVAMGTPGLKSYKPKKTITGYKLFRTLKNRPGEIFPLFIGKTKPTTMGEWIEAEFIPTKGFAQRPGWHTGILPIAPHLRQKSTGKKDPDRVWAEVEIPADKNWQAVADQSETKDIRDEVPKEGHYRFETNKMQGGAWYIGGAIKVNKLLLDKEVVEILTDAGYSKEETSAETASIGKEPAGLREYRLTQAALKEQTGQTITGEAAIEAENLRLALKMTARNARKAHAAGNKAGVVKEKQRMAVILERAKQRRKDSAAIKKTKAQITKELKQSKVKKQSGKPKGRYGAERQATLDLMRSWVIGKDKLTKKAAGELLAERVAQQAEADIQMPTEFEFIENKLLAVIAAPFHQTDLAFTTSLLNDIKAFKFTGEMERERKKQNRLAYHEVIIDEIIEIIGGVDSSKAQIGGKVRPEDKGLKQRIRNLLFASGATNFVQAWDDLLDIISYQDKSSKPGKSIISEFGNVHEQENAEKLGNMEAMESLQKMVMETYGLKNTAEMSKMFDKDSVEVNLGTFKDLNDNPVEMTFTKAEARKAIMALLDPSLYDTFFSEKGGMHWSQPMVTALYDMMTAQDLEFIQKQMEWYQAYYASINEVYREIYGVNLPSNPFYSPISREGVNKAEDANLGEFLKDAPFRASAAGQGSIKSRVVNYKPITQQSDISVLMRHVMEMEHFKAWSQKIRDLNSVFNNVEVRAAIAENFGQNVNQHLEDTIQDLASGGNERSNMYGFWDRVRIKYTQSVLAVKVSLFVKQLSSTMAFADAIPVVYWSTEFGKVLMPQNLLKATKVLFEGSTMVRHRWEQGGMERDIAAAIKTDEYKAFKAKPSFINKLMFMVRLGDMAAIIAGGYPVYKYYLGKTGSKEEAIRHFESVASSTQQSSDISKQSSMQRGNAFMKLFTMFKTSPTQYLRKEIGAVRNLSAGRISSAQFMKTIVIYHFILPLIFQTMSEMVIGGDEDEDALVPWLTKGQKRAMFLGSLNGYFIVGDGLDYMLKKMIGIYADLPTIAPNGIWRDLTRAMRLFDWDDLEDEEILSAVRGLAGAVGAVTGLPAKQTVDIGTGISDVVAGEYEKGIMEIAGWSPHAAEKATGD